MVTFAQLRHASFESLDKAGDTWNGVAGRTEQIAGQVRSGVLHPLTGASPGSLAPGGGRTWTGTAADEATREIGLLSDELTAFHYEALAVTAALRRAGSAFAQARQNLLRAVGDAEALGATVATDGTVTLPPLPPEDRNDPDAIAYQRRKWDELQQYVEAMGKAVSAATAADAAAAAALRALDPAEVDPATRPDAVAHAGGDLVRAAGMPSDPKALRTWWGALDPAVRAGLLAADGERLLAAGVLGPVEYEWHAPDAGAGDYAQRPPGAGDYANGAAAEALLVGGGNLVGYTDAARHLQHFLTATGEPLAVEVDRMLDDDPDFRLRVAQQISDHQAQWRQLALDAFERSGGAPVAVPVEAVAHRNIDASAQRNWFLAIGSHPYATSGVVTARPGPDGRPVVSVQYQVNVWDRYNWDPGKSTPIAFTNIKDSDLAELHRTGLAREFDLTGRSTPVTVALPGTPSSPPGGGTGQDGARDAERSNPGRETR
ncbi:hypothetical protein ACFVVL_17950 [Kitasatospora sp. NPDC058115]|uniref:hypothetical protein n=1 Tax=Kitasatospora sp. NPDC058115 TaxID=3346347 RepID=UPI0036D9099E